MTYVLYNKELQRYLKHPKDGVWASQSLEEAQDLLDAAKAYVKAVGVPELADNLTILEVESDLS